MSLNQEHGNTSSQLATSGSRSPNSITLFRGEPELLKAFRAGDKKALESVYRRCQRPVAAVLRRGFVVRSKGGGFLPALTDSWLVEDIVQEVFLRAFSRHARLAFDGERPYLPYLLTIARNHVIDLARQRRRALVEQWSSYDEEPASTPESRGLDGGCWGAEDALHQGRVQEQTRRCLEGLDAHEQRLVWLRYVEEHSQTEAATRLGLSRGQLRIIEQRIIHRLRVSLVAVEPSRWPVHGNRKTYGKLGRDHA